MGLIRCYGFPLFCSILFFLNICHQSELESYDFKDNKYLANVCKTLEIAPPQTQNDCVLLLFKIACRYADESLAEKVKKGTPNNILDWKILFYEVEVKYKKADSLLKTIGLKKIPVHEIEWDTVKSFIGPKLKNVVHLKDKRKIQSVLDSTYTSKLDYVNGFITISELYFSCIPSSKGNAILKYFDLDEMPDGVVLDLIEKIGEKYFELKNILALFEAIHLSGSFMEESERQSLITNTLWIEEAKQIITKILILEDYYGLRLEKMKRVKLEQLRVLNIEDFLDSNATYKAFTRYKFTTTSTVVSSKYVSSTQTNPITAVYNNYMKNFESPEEELDTRKRKPVPKRSNHYVICRLMLLTDKPRYITDIKLLLQGKNQDHICMSWQSLYNKLCGYVHKPQNPLKTPIPIEDKIEAIKDLKMDPDVLDLFTTIIEVESKYF